MQIKLLRNTLVRQLLGTVCGAVIAMLAYQGYEVFSPQLQAWFPASTASQTQGISATQKNDHIDHIVLLARQKLGMIQGQ